LTARPEPAAASVSKGIARSSSQARTRPKKPVAAPGGRNRSAETEQRDAADDRSRLFSMSEDVICIVRPDGDLVVLNPAFERIFGWTLQEVQVMPRFHLLHPDDVATTLEAMQRLAEGASPSIFENRYRCRDGSYRWLSWNTVFDRERGLVFAIAHDVTLRKRNEEDLRKSEERYRALFEDAILGIYRTTPDGRILSANTALVEMLGYENVESLKAINLEVLDYFAPSYSRTQFKEKIEREDVIRGEEGAWKRKDGSIVYVRENARCIRGADGRVRYYEGSVEDISDRKRAEAALRESEANFRRIYEWLPLGYQSLDGDGRLLDVNDAWCRALGYRREDVIGRSFENLLDASARLSFADCFARLKEAGSLFGVAIDLVSGQGETRHMQFNARVEHDAEGRFIRTHCTMHDVTEQARLDQERRQVETRLQQAQKLESLSVLAGGVAHDFNNLLTGIIGYASLMLVDLPLRSPLRHQAEQILAASRRAAGLAGQMLAFSGRGKFVLQSIDLSVLTENLQELVAAAVGHARLEFRPASEPVWIEVDLDQLHQALLNLVANAAEAIGKEEGRIIVRTGKMAADREFLKEVYPDEPLPEGEYAFIEVEDSGCGMNEATKARVFDPFFSTKFSGRGLGLAAVLGIVRGHNGRIKIRTAPGQGTTFTLLFPQARPYKSNEAADRIGDVKGAPARRQTILVIDDEEIVRELANSVLGRAGYRVILAKDGHEGLEAFSAARTEIDLVFLDLTMPRLSGGQAYKQLRLLKPEVRVALTSGYNRDERPRAFEGLTHLPFIKKPYRPDELTEFIRRQLEKNS